MTPKTIHTAPPTLSHLKNFFFIKPILSCLIVQVPATCTYHQLPIVAGPDCYYQDYWDHALLSWLIKQ